MEGSKIGGRIAILLIVAFLGWSVVRSLGARTPAAPRGIMPQPALDASLTANPGQETVVLAGGCFWGVQGVFEHVKGVQTATSGYSGGFLKAPSYEAVSTGLTGHAEAVQVTYDPAQISLGQILMIYFSVAHDPTQLNRQGPDTGSQYRSAIFYSTPQQEKIAAGYIAQLGSANIYGEKIVTRLTPFEAFYAAEGYHQDYLRNHPDDPYIVHNDLPKIANLKKNFPALYREN